ncbi:MAG: hypothetical protein U5J63_16645 [Fodinibius sp.]|nr:hypothetical protein [Fodinibius sp.]
MRNIQDIHIVVVGAARSGLAVASLLKRKGGRVFVTDHNAIADPVKAATARTGYPIRRKGTYPESSRRRIFGAEPRRAHGSSAGTAVLGGRQRGVF